MFTVWESIKQSFKTVFLLGVVTWSIHWGSVRPQSLRRGCFIPSTPPPSGPLPSLSRCECHVVLSLGTFACVAVSGGEVCLFCVTDKKTPPPPSTCVFCCVIWSLALTFTSLAPSLSDGAACSLCQEIHEPHSANGVSYVFPTATSPQLLKKKKNFQTIVVLILGCRAWKGLASVRVFYCHSILRLHFCHRRIL